ncbi:MAG: aryl-sulfate sulfotransferase [Myxococcota bacterium]
MSALWFAMGCRPEDPGIDSGSPGTIPVDSATSAGTPVVTWSPLVPTVAWVDWAAPADATAVRVEFGADGAFDRATGWSTPGELPPGGLAVVGLAAGRTYTARVAADTPAGPASSAPVTLAVPAAPPDLPVLVIDRSDAGAEVPSGYLWSAVSTSLGGDAQTDLVVWNGAGEIVWYVRSERGHITVSPSVGQTPGTLWWDDYDMTDLERRATLVRATLDGRSLDRVALPNGHHAALEVEPGIVAWIAHDVRPAPDGVGSVTADRLYEAPFDDTAHPREVVNLYDALFHGAFDPPCDHTTTGIPYGSTFPVFEWSHENSLAYLADRDRYLVNLRWLDTVVAIDRSTGTIAWSLGGPYGSFTTPTGGSIYGSADDSLLSHAHWSDAWDGGLVAFDNGTHHDPPLSSIVTLAWDEDARTVAETSRWTDPEQRFVGILGDARQLPGGDVLSSWSVLGELREVTPAGEVVWSAHTEAGGDGPAVSIGRVRWLSELVP